MSSSSPSPSLFNSRWPSFNRPVFDLLLVVRRLDSRSDQGFDVNYKDIVTAIVNHVTSFNACCDCSVDHAAVGLQMYYEVLDVCEVCYQVVLSSSRSEECGCATLALAAVHLTLKKSLSRFTQLCTQLLANIKSSSKFVAKLCSFLNKHNQTYLLFFVSDTEFSLENDVMSYEWISAKREILERIILERLHEANNDDSRQDANMVQSHLSTLIDKPIDESDTENATAQQPFDC